MKGKELKQKGIKIKLDKERHLLFDLNSFVELEEKFGDIQTTFTALEKGSIKGIRTLLWAGLIHEDEELTEKQVGKMIDLKNITKISELIAQALSDAMPEVENNDIDDIEKN